jgi:hypothetical protein
LTRTSGGLNQHCLKVTHFRKRAIIAYTLEIDVVSIGGVFYGGQAYEAALAPDDDQ